MQLVLLKAVNEAEYIETFQKGNLPEVWLFLDFWFALGFFPH